VINRPPAEVFEFVTDFRNDTKWWKLVTHSEKLTEGEIGVGTVFIQHAKVMFVAVQNQLQVLEWDAPNYVKYRNDSNQLGYDLLYQFEPVEGGTRFSHHVNLEMKGILNLLKPITMRILDAQQKKYFNVLKQVMESESH